MDATKLGVKAQKKFRSIQKEVASAVDDLKSSKPITRVDFDDFLVDIDVRGKLEKAKSIRDEFAKVIQGDGNDPQGIALHQNMLEAAKSLVHALERKTAFADFMGAVQDLIAKKAPFLGVRDLSNRLQRGVIPDDVAIDLVHVREEAIKAGCQSEFEDLLRKGSAWMKHQELGVFELASAKLRAVARPLYDGDELRGPGKYFVEGILYAFILGLETTVVGKMPLDPFTMPQGLLSAFLIFSPAAFLSLLKMGTSGFEGELSPSTDSPRDVFANHKE